MIYTFYSYKGGVGRTMALANIAELFSEAGLHVLAVDWDLEAPGLERFFFADDIERALHQRGVIDMLLEYKRRMADVPSSQLGVQDGSHLLENPQTYLLETETRNVGSGRLSVLTAGRRSRADFEAYAHAVLSFDWQDFYQNWEGELYIEWLRKSLSELADVVLIDSRTGVTEMGGVCTYQLADVIVILCATNQQNLEGVYRMALDFRRPEVQNLRSGRPLDVLVIPARLEQAEGDRLNEFKTAFLTRSNAFAPSVVVIRNNPDVLWSLGIPYVPYYAYNEEVAVRNRGTAIAEPLVNAFERLARIMARLAPLESPLKRVYGTDVTYDSALAGSKETGYAYDVFVSYAHSDAGWVWDWLIPRLRNAGLRVCIDRETFLPGTTVIDNIERSIKTSRYTLIVLSPEWTASIWPTVNEVGGSRIQDRVVPVLLRQCEIPEPLRPIQYADFAEDNGSETKLNLLIDALRVRQKSPTSKDQLGRTHLDASENLKASKLESKERGVPSWLPAGLHRTTPVLMLGADLPLDYPGSPPSFPELARLMNERDSSLTLGNSWPDIASQYEARYGRHSLVSFLREQMDPMAGPGRFHRAIASVDASAIITSWYDEAVPQALRDAGYRVTRLVRESDVAYAPASSGERQVVVVQLFGSIDQPDTLVITARDQYRLISSLGRRLTALRAFLAVRPLVIAGFDPTSPFAMALYSSAVEGLPEHMVRAYFVWSQVSPETRNLWQGSSVQFIDVSPLEFIEALVPQPAFGQLVARARSIRVLKPPYKFLDYYEAKDADIFCGRDTESQIVARLVLSYRMLTLFSPSGAGKTSLLLAGVLPRLAAEGYNYVYVRALDAPIAAVRKAIATRVSRTDWQTGADLRAFLTASLDEKDRLVIVLDQFEELFLRVDSRHRASFFEQLAQALTQPERDVRVVFSLREDYLSHMDEARAFLPDVLANSYRLVALNRGNARVAITEPAARAGVIVESALADALVGPDGQGDLVESSGQVPPAALQIVMDRLYRQALPAEHAEGDPPPPGLTLSLAAYQAFRHIQGQGADARELSGAEAILAGYVAEGLDRLLALRNEDGTPLGADLTLGQAILQAMVTSQRTKAALTHDEILAALDEAGVIRQDDEDDQRTAKATQLGLERVRLLRSFTRDNVSYDELAHDYLAREIAASISQAEMQPRAVRELLRREVDSWQRHGLLIAPEALRLIDEQREALRKLRSVEAELVLRSALKEGHEAPYWFGRARAAGVPADAIAREGLGSDSFRARAAAVRALAELGDLFMDDIVGLLADLYPQVRMAAIASLERLRPDGAWRKSLKYECYVPAGEFIMGDDKGDRDDQKPAHKVTLNAFYIGKYPVTNAEYARFMADRGRGFDLPAGKEQHPVVSISWYDAKDYADWAGMRLPTEAQWEKAASWELAFSKSDKMMASGRKRQYPWGDEFDKNRCNTSESGIHTTTPVGKYSPAGDSPWGVTDLAGNIREWTNSLYVPYPYRADKERESPHEMGRRSIRGGSFDADSEASRPTNRVGEDPSYRRANLGMRIALSIDIRKGTWNETTS